MTKWRPTSSLALWYEKRLKDAGLEARDTALAVAEAAFALRRSRIAQVRRKAGGYLGIGEVSKDCARIHLERLVEWGAVSRTATTRNEHGWKVARTYQVREDFDEER